MQRCMNTYKHYRIQAKLFAEQICRALSSHEALAVYKSVHLGRALRVRPDWGRETSDRARPTPHVPTFMVHPLLCVQR